MSLLKPISFWYLLEICQIHQSWLGNETSASDYNMISINRKVNIISSPLNSITNKKHLLLSIWLRKPMTRQIDEIIKKQEYWTQFPMSFHRMFNQCNVWTLSPISKCLVTGKSAACSTKTIPLSRKEGPHCTLKSHMQMWLAHIICNKCTNLTHKIACLSVVEAWALQSHA